MPLGDANKLIRQIQAGDEYAFERLFNEFQPRLFRFIWHLVRSEVASNDLVQNIFLKIWRNREHWNPGSSLSSYLYRAARNAALNHLRDSKSDLMEEVNELHTAERDPAAALEAKETQQAIQECVNALPPGCRTVFVMSRYEDARYREIAEALEISVKTVENQMGRALRLLRVCLKAFI